MIAGTGSLLTDGLAILGWPGALALAWVLGEAAYRALHLPRPSTYGLIGFVLGPGVLGWLPPTEREPAMLVANIAFGLVLFEFGYRINWRWFATNRWLAASGLLEAGLAFAAVLGLALATDMAPFPAVLLATLAMSTSPAAVLRGVNDNRGAGQVTERMLHLTALNAVVAVVLFKVVVGVWLMRTTGGGWASAVDTVASLVVSVTAGALFGHGAAWLMRRVPPESGDATVPFALAVALLVVATHYLRLSPVLATLSFGFVARHRRVAFSQPQRNFGPVGDILSILMFLFVASTLEWPRVLHGLGLGLAVLVVRAAAKIAGTTLLAERSGATRRKGVLTGIGMSPISVFVILLLEQERYLGVDFVDQLAPLAAITLLLELGGPLLTRFALVQARESGHRPATADPR